MLSSEKIHYFIEVVRNGSFSNAAKKMDVAISTVTKAVTALEKEVDKKLIERLKSGVVLTETGKLFYESIIDSFLKIDHNFNFIKQTSIKEKKSLKIITTTGAVSLWIMPRLKRFIEKYPTKTIKIETVNHSVSLTHTDADVAIFPRIDDPGNVTKKKLLTVHNRLFASPEYLEKYGRPKKVEDLKNHRLISYYHDKRGYLGNVDWHINACGNDCEPALVVNSAVCQYFAAALGLGIIAIAEEFPFIVGTMEEVLEDHQGVDIDVYFITRKNLNDDVLINELYDNLVGGVT